MDGKVALVTGAAGGIGAAVARALGQRGAIVAAVDRDRARLATEVAKLVADGLAGRAFPADVSNGSEVEVTVDAVEQGLGPIEFLVNTAGVLRTGTAWRLAEADWADCLAVNATGVFHMSRAVANRMVPRSRGAIVTVSSNAARVPRAGMAAYAAAKAAASMFTLSLGLETARHRIRCNVVAPGSTDTPMLRSLWGDESDSRHTIDGQPEVFRVGIPMGRIGRPSDVAEAVAFLLSERAGHITMHTLTVDGGAGLGA